MRTNLGPALALALALAACTVTKHESEVHPARQERAAPTPSTFSDGYREAATRIRDAVASDCRAYDKLAYLCDRIGHRLSGSPGLEKAVQWAHDTAVADGLEARLEAVTVPVWVRGRESATLVAPVERKLHMLGLGNSVGTPPGGIAAEVIAVRDFDEFVALGDRVKGKIVLYTAKMPPYDPEKGAGYGATVKYRTAGPSRAAAAGAVAALVRSVTARSLQSPHTGMLRYDGKAPQIPAAAVTTEDAELLERLLAAGEKVVVRLEMEAHFEADAQSANVIGELRGSEKPDEVVVFGGHLDTWDVGQGAQDDGGAVAAILESLRILKAAGLRPRRTIRAVLFVNEENGVAGGRAYAERHRDELKDHVAAIEADSGIAKPLGFTAPRPVDERTIRIRRRLADLVKVLEPLGAAGLRDGGGGTDVEPMGAYGVPLLGFDVDGRGYFDVHHTDADTLDKVSRADLDQCVAVLATTVYVLADMPERLSD
jgi:Zn-dependent M28 family amino/carboxypeptidase